jgi:putative membrane protein
LVTVRLTTDERARVQKALATAQVRTDARLALMIVAVSDRYAMYPLSWAGMAALAIGAGLALFCQTIGLRLGFLLEAAAFGLTALALEWRPLLLAVVPKRVKQTRARNMAHREFAAGILAAQDRKEGILFFAALGEHYVEIVASRDVHARVGAEAWARIVGDFTARASSSNLADAFISAIEACAYHLEAHFPPSPVDTHG